MLKKVVTLQRTPSPALRRKLQRQLAESNNVQDVAFDQNRMILHLYRRVPNELLLEEFTLPEQPQVVEVE